LQAAGHAVKMGTREPGKLAGFLAENPGVTAGSFAEAAAFGELIILAVKGTAASVALNAAGAPNLAGKPVVDATNPIADAPPDHGVLKFFTTLEDSLMERLQREFPAARFVKAFNSVGSALMIRPKLAGGKPTMFLCGNDDAAKKAVVGLLDQLGWESADMGSVEAARAIEPLCILWCIPGFLRQDWAHAFKLLS
jgi:hypothetical protein